MLRCPLCDRRFATDDGDANTDYLFAFHIYAAHPGLVRHAGFSDFRCWCGYTTDMLYKGRRSIVAHLVAVGMEEHLMLGVLANG